MEEQTKNQVLRGVELLWQCLELQSAKDGIDRPGKNCFDKTKTVDSFTQDIIDAALHMHSLLEIHPIMDKLVFLGKKLEADGKIKLDYSDSYPEAVMTYLFAQNGLNSQGAK